MTKFLAFFAIALGWIVTPSLAEPSPSVTFLMNEPVSMFTYGMDALTKKMEAVAPEKNLVAEAFYDRDGDRILLLATCFETSGCKMEGTEAACANLIQTIRQKAGVSKTIPMYGVSSFADLFVSGNHPIKNAPADLRKQLDKKMLVRVTMEQKNGADLVCTGPLTGTGYSVER